ncbi:MAG: CpsD/CapB family tyrosine-protein kinase, partial [Candidatus Saccharimonadales bacterium]
IGGCAPNAGKSFLSVNLAHITGSADGRVLLIDADLRRGHLYKYLNGVRSPGLSDILARGVDSTPLIQRSPYNENVDFLPSGEYPPNPFELLSKPDMKALLDEFLEAYKLIIVDVPPILSVADGAVISRLVTTNFLVVRSGYQKIQEVRLALDRFEHNGAHLTGFILNDLSPQAQSYAYGEYGGAYKSYRYDSKKAK